MKSLITFILFTIFYQHAHAQTVINYDKEKLLEFYQSQRYADAAEYLQGIYPEEIQDVKVLQQIAYCFMMAGKLPEAEKNYLKIINQQPTSIPVLFSLANINIRRGNDTNAKLYLENIITLDSSNFNAYKQLAGLYHGEVDSQKVLYLQKANKLNPIEADVAINLSSAYRRLKKYEPAYEILALAIEADTGNFTLQQVKLPIAIQLKKFKEVITTGEKLLQQGDDENVLKDVGMAYYYLKNYEKAIEYFKKLEGLKAQNESTLYYTSLSYRNLENFKQAAEYAKKTINEGISPYTPIYYQLLGGIYEVNNQPNTAISAYKKGLTFGANGSIYYRLGILYDTKLNQKKTALLNYKLYLKSKPDAIVEKAEITYVKQRIVALGGSKSESPKVQ
ncbi:tetratricopeptide repeat protein [Pedobacter sp. Du54]|uniref:tetratricopeptide repeat protein n=1 Tax=Pedobacter anseongensis TaxID=3133439 RepID=UPI0030A8F212